jgi:hypothetical protein
VQEQDHLVDLPHVQIFMNDGPNPLTLEAQLLSYWFSRNPAVFQDSVLRHREVGRAKDLSAPPRSFHAQDTKQYTPPRVFKNIFDPFLGSVTYQKQYDRAMVPGWGMLKSFAMLLWFV